MDEPGWYVDENDNRFLVEWDGQQWTGETRPNPSAPNPLPMEPPAPWTPKPMNDNSRNWSLGCALLAIPVVFLAGSFITVLSACGAFGCSAPGKMVLSPTEGLIAAGLTGTVIAALITTATWLNITDPKNTKTSPGKRTYGKPLAILFIVCLVIAAQLVLAFAGLDWRGHPR